MRFSNNSDVKNHLSARRNKHLTPSKPENQPSTGEYAENKIRDTGGNLPNLDSGNSEAPSLTEAAGVPVGTSASPGKLVEISANRKP